MLIVFAVVFLFTCLPFFILVFAVILNSTIIIFFIFLFIMLSNVKAKHEYLMAKTVKVK